ncbi:MAG: response regulator [Bacteroidales bacterium]|mgnify:CR=1 FL=1|jgi:CheY-like chemotaxis protein|nr:response regulator [Bacteroidales bacterium]MDI9534123.1 response regulator [Bacteroidota bacterium]MBK7733354.1 response regulator [Bacteroidales bacterium]MBP7036994.1 response regulator [Bacteroidales bacterium]MBP8709849.1 response regulator [Bacteroidales bacterium]
MKDPSSSKRMAILIVEDDPYSQLYFAKLLSDMYDTAVADCAADAWDLLHDRKFDLVLMDISLKGDEDGLSLTRRLRAEEDFKKLPIIAVTAYAFPDDRMRAMKAGCTDYLPKPVSSNDLYRKITEFTR